METLQTRFMRLLDDRAKGAGLDLVVSYSFSNCGILHFMRSDGFDETLAIPFDFQRGEVTLGWMGPNKRAREVFYERPNPKFAGFRSGELDDAIDALLEAACH